MPPSKSAAYDFPQQKSMNPTVWSGELQHSDMTVSIHSKYLFGDYNSIFGHLPSGLVCYTEMIRTMPEITIHDFRNSDTCFCMCIEGDPEGLASHSDNFLFRELGKRVRENGYYGFEVSKNVLMYLKNDNLSRLLSRMCPEAYCMYGGMNYMLMVLNK